MVNLAKKYNFISKEHNGDYIPVSIIKEKFDLGLDSINIELKRILMKSKNQNY